MEALARGRFDLSPGDGGLGGEPGQSLVR
jgi:hypothetical protein